MRISDWSSDVCSSDLLFQEQDYGVMLVAGDTFRAAAIGQLKVWAERLGVPIMAGPAGGDAAGIVFDAVKQATAAGIDGLIVDTPGRLQKKREQLGSADARTPATNARIRCRL